MDANFALSGDRHGPLPIVNKYRIISAATFKVEAPFVERV
jgi:hypothetical protein